MKRHRSWTIKSGLEMVQIVLGQQLRKMELEYPNYALTIELLKGTIVSFGKVDRVPPRVG